MATSEATLQPGGRTRPRPEPVYVRFALALVIAFALTWLSAYWIRQSEIIILACQVTEAVPPIPAVAVLLVLVLLNPLLRRIPRLRGLSSGEIAIIYVFTTVATTMFGCAIVRFLISLLSAGHYYSSGEFPMEQIVSNIPAWLAPKHPLVYRALYEGAPSGNVPWNVWWLPILAWAGFFTLLGGALIGAMMLMADRWIDHERLAFPLVQLPLEMMGKGQSGSFFKNKAMWIGFGAAALLNLYKASNAVWGGGKTGTMYFTIGQSTFEYPWAAVVPFSIHIRPELIGLGYLVSTEVSFSIWFSWLLHQIEAIWLSTLGVRVQGIPFVREQGIGVYFALGLILLWKDRAVLRMAWEGWAAVPGPGYHWYTLPAFKLGPYLRTFASKAWLKQTNLSGLYDAAHPEQEWKAYWHLRLRGPNYPYGSTLDPDMFCLDRLVLVKAAPREKLPEKLTEVAGEH